MIKHFCLALAIGLTAAPSLSWAQCQVQANPLGTMRYNALVAQSTVVLTNMDVQCDIPTAVRLQASQGQSGNYTQRQMGSGLARLNYNLFLGTNDTFIWGDGTMGTAEATAVVEGQYRFVGNVRIHANQNPPVGIYSDTLVFTLIF